MSENKNLENETATTAEAYKKALTMPLKLPSGALVRVYRSTPLAQFLGMTAMRKAHLEEIIQKEQDKGEPLSPDERELLEINYGEKSNTEIMTMARNIISEGPTFDELDGIDQAQIWGHVNLSIAAMTKNMGAGIIANAAANTAPGHDGPMGN